MGGVEVGDAAHQRVGGDAGESIGAAAFHAENELGNRNGLAPKLTHIGGEFTHRLDAGLDFIRHLLGVEPADALGGLRADDFQEVVHLIVLTSQAEHEHGGGVGVADKSREHLLGVLEVVAELRAAKGMAESVNPIDAGAGCGQLGVGGCRDLLGGDIHAADRVDDPDFVPGGGASIWAPVSLESLLRFASRAWGFLRLRDLAVPQVGELF